MVAPVRPARLPLALSTAALAIAIAYAVLVFRVGPAAGFGQGYAFLLISVLALPTMAVTFQVERSTGVKTPWRPVGAGFILAALAYAL